MPTKCLAADDFVLHAVNAEHIIRRQLESIFG